MDREKEPAEPGLRIKAAVCWIASGALVIIMACSLVMYRNPWRVHSMEADEVTSEKLAEIADSRSPYVRIDGMELSFTGYYKTGSNEEVCSYCYKGRVGDQFILVSLSADDGGELIQNSDAVQAVLTDYTVEGQLVPADEMTAFLAQTEQMTQEEYIEYYDMADEELCVYGSDREKIRIYQMMLIVIAAGAFATGWIFRSEYRSADPDE